MLILSEQEIRFMCEAGQAQFISCAGRMPRPTKVDVVFADVSLIDAYQFHVIGDAVYTVLPMQEHYELVRDADIRVLSKLLVLDTRGEGRKRRGRDYRRRVQATPTWAVAVY